MKLDLSKVKEIVIKDKDGNITDRFELSQAQLIKDKINGTRLVLIK